ncbi:DNA-binding protein RFX8 [Rhinatrema bivittatum]|uniref:DNA-binding protein RFX8 n=1 Tax=Rhinatrema bivittatum TaxID=194408 RepID=UPI00112E0A97|nr:DNA-binding protein RFX8 [Rhinatrema bivittatum]
MALSTQSRAGSSRAAHGAVVQWLFENFHVCEGCSIPRCLMYEIYLETCGQSGLNQVNPATFGKLVRLVFPDLGTRRLGTRGSASTENFCNDGRTADYEDCNYRRQTFQVSSQGEYWEKVFRNLFTFIYSAERIYKNCFYYKESHLEQSGVILQAKKDGVGCSVPEFSRFTLWEQEIAKKHPFKPFAFLTDEYYNYCQDILQNIRNKELDRVEDLVAFFWKSLSHDAVILMSLPDVCQLFKCYDAQLYKEIENILLHDFLEDVAIQYLKTVRLFSKKLKLWLLTALEGLPAIIQLSKNKEVTVFVKRLRRKTCLSNLAKTTRTVLNDIRAVSILKSSLDTILNQGILDVPRKPLNFRNMEEMDSGLELKCLDSLISLLGTSTDLRVFLNCVTSLLQAFVFQPSKSKEEFRKLAAHFQLKWNFLLTSVSRAMTLFHAESLGSWHLLNLLLLEYVIHILQSCIEEEDDIRPTEDLQQHRSFSQTTQESTYLLEVSVEEAKDLETPHKAMENISQCDLNLNNIMLKVLGFLVDTSTGNKLIQVMLEDPSAKSVMKLNLPVGQETVVTLKDGQKFVIHTSNIQQSSISICTKETKQDVLE